jgi:hypothetical protein
MARSAALRRCRWGGCQLKVHVLGGHEGLEGCRGFVVKTLELGTKAALGEKSMSALIGG